MHSAIKVLDFAWYKLTHKRLWLLIALAKLTCTPESCCSLYPTYEVNFLLNIVAVLVFSQLFKIVVSFWIIEDVTQLPDRFFDEYCQIDFTES